MLHIAVHGTGNNVYPHVPTSHCVNCINIQACLDKSEWWVTQKKADISNFRLSGTTKTRKKKEKKEKKKKKLIAKIKKTNIVDVWPSYQQQSSNLKWLGNHKESQIALHQLCSTIIYVWHHIPVIKCVLQQQYLQVVLYSPPSREEEGSITLVTLLFTLFLSGMAAHRGPEAVRLVWNVHAVSDFGLK